MMATIEPRLIHLLNESQSPHLSHPSLPPLQDVTYPKTSVRPLPLEPDAGRRAGDGSGTGLNVLSSKPSFPCLYRPQHDEPLPLSGPGRRDDVYPTAERTNSLRMILDDDVDLYETSSSSHHPLRKLRDEHTESNEDLSSKKRHHALTGKEDFPQLPHPLKKQKSSNTVHMPPIINGLHEPPPNAAIFPPISSGSFHDPESIQLGLLREFPARSEDNHNSANVSPTAPTPDGSDKAFATVTSKLKRRAAKPRRKWSDEETKHLLLGVHKHGVGRWTDILDDPEFKFNDRTAGDLKDRFRTCCPEELRSKRDKDKDKSPTAITATKPKSRPTPGPLQIESILEPGEPPSSKPDSPNDTGPSGKPRKSRAHRKNMEDLAELGIYTPFKKSHRRERRPFLEQDDREILEGFQKYGPQWTKIQRDPKFHLSNRQATDLRDRLRNKRPDLFNNSTKTQLKDASKCGPLEPSVNMTVEHSLNMSRSSTSLTSLNHSNSREDMPKWHYQPSDQTISGPMDWNEPTHVLTGPPSMSSLNNDMGISRLLLDDSQVNNDPPRQMDGASASSSPTSGLPDPHAVNRNDYNDRRVFG